VSTFLDVRAMDGTVTATVALDSDIFAVQPNVPLMHQVVTAQRAAGRAGTQSTKTRAEVSGGGAKPFKQKGTGRARQGSTRAPHYAGGGVALGPKPRKYRQRTPKKMVQLALRCALSDRANSDRIIVVDKWDFEVPNTKAAQAALDVFGVAGRALVVLTRDDERAYKSLRNLTDVDLLLVGELAAYDVLCSDWLVFTRQTLPGNNVWAEAEVVAEARAPAPKAKPAPPAAVVEPSAEPGAQEDEGADGGAAPGEVVAAAPADAVAAAADAVAAAPADAVAADGEPEEA
jgi:large subunit ribosomal protein L4